jgi:O-antigen/teichoic acid export membrane protein
MGHRIASVGGMRAAAVGLTALQVLVLSRVLGASGLGAFSIVSTWLLVLATVAVGGFGRFVQRAVGRGGPEAAQAVTRSLRTTSALGLALACLVLVVGLSMPGRDAGVIVLLALMIALGVPLFVLTATLFGLGAVGIALLPDVLGAALVIGCTLAASVVMAQVPLTVPLGAMLAAIVASLVLCSVAVGRRMPLTGTWRAADHPGIWTQLRDVRVLSAISAMAMLMPSVPLIFIGLLSTDEQAGYYAIAAKLGMLVMLPLQVVGLAALADLSASAHHLDPGPLVVVYRRARRLSGLGSMLIAVVLLLTLPLALQILGASAQEAAVAAVIIIVAQVVNSATGAVGFSLMMLHHEVRVLRWQVVAFVASVVISAVFIGRFGAVAGALATAAGLIILNTALILVLRALSRPDGWTVTRVAES